MTPAMDCYKEEIFGPVLVCLEVRPAVRLEVTLWAAGWVHAAAGWVHAAAALACAGLL